MPIRLKVYLNDDINLCKADGWTAVGKSDIWGTIPQVTEMQSEGGSNGAVHGALQAGALMLLSLHYRDYCL